jgi:hypothetical protein
MSNFHFNQTTNDYLNSNIVFSYDTTNNDTQTTKLLKEYNKRQSVILNNLKTELDQNQKILKNDITLVFQKNENNNTLIFNKYSKLLSNLFTVLTNKTNQTNF